MAKRSVNAPTASDMTEGGRIDKEGVFHLLVKSVADMEKVTGDAGEGFTIELQALTGDQEGKTLKTFLPDGSPVHKDGGAFALKKQCAFLVAANAIAPAQLNGGSLEFDPADAAGHQVIAKLKFGKPNAQGNQYLDVSGLDIYHVDDPRAPKCDRSDEALSAIAADFRKPAEYFAPLTSRHSAAAAPASKLDFDDSDL